MMRTKTGYILSLSLILIFLSMFMVTYLANRGSVFEPYAHIAIERKKAYLLAQGGVDLAISQLIAPKSAKKEKKEAEQKPSAEDRIKDMLTELLPVLNRWQTVELDEVRDGMAGTLRYCIMCENGKLDLNALYDFDAHTFINASNSADTKKMYQDLFDKIKKYADGKELFGPFESLLKEKKYRFNDATELLGKPFESFKDAVFYQPPEPDQKSRSIYLMDIFTVWTGKRLLNPWLLSDSMTALMGLNRAQADVAERKKVVAQWVKPFKLKADWSKDWDTVLRPLYGKDYNGIPKSLQPFLSGTFEARVFSVLSYATVGRITQRLYAIVERVDDTSDMHIKKVYWL